MLLQKQSKLFVEELVLLAGRYEGETDGSFKIRFPNLRKRLIHVCVPMHVICGGSDFWIRFFLSDNLIRTELLEHFMRDDLNRNAPRSLVVLKPLKVS